MNAMAPPRPTERHRSRVCLAAGPAAAAQARREVRAALGRWAASVDPDIAVLLTSELVTNAIRHEAGETVTLAVSCSRGQLRVDVHDTCCSWPEAVDACADAETGRGLMLVATLSADWGFYRTPAGKAVYFTLDFETDLPNVPVVPAARSSRRDGAKRCLAGDVSPRVDVELLQDVRDVGRDGAPGEQ
jgi:anti-sigma regulatory factor (Ser/Thr protein kinase)